MIYLDTAFIAKCYLSEPGAERVQERVLGEQGVASCELARVELASILLRRRRERLLSAVEQRRVEGWVEADEQAGVWHWLPLNSALVTAARATLLELPPAVFLRAADALHLACARQHGFSAIYSNDRHLLAAARHFQLEGVDLLA